MNHKRPGAWIESLLGTLALSLLLIFLPLEASAGTNQELTLRVNDLTGLAGGRVAVVIRTYAPRPVGQGQICLRVDLARAQGGPTLLALEDFIVFSSQGDAQSTGSFQVASQTAIIDFSSLSGSINDSDGPLAVLFFRVAGGLQPGTTIPLVFDDQDTWLVDAAGRPVNLRLREGDLVIRGPGSPVEIEAFGTEVGPGQAAAVGVETEEYLPLSSGTLVFRYPPALVSGTPEVRMDPRHGQVSFTADTATPGIVRIEFTSPTLTYNSVPGEIVNIELPTNPAAPVGSVGTVDLDPAESELFDASGQPLPLLLQSDLLELISVVEIFQDGFESGDLSAWN